MYIYIYIDKLIGSTWCARNLGSSPRIGHLYVFESLIREFTVQWLVVHMFYQIAVPPASTVFGRIYELKDYDQLVAFPCRTPERNTRRNTSNSSVLISSRTTSNDVVASTNQDLIARPHTNHINHMHCITLYALSINSNITSQQIEHVRAGVGKHHPNKRDTHPSAHVSLPFVSLALGSSSHILCSTTTNSSSPRSTFFFCCVAHHVAPWRHCAAYRMHSALQQF